MTYRTTSVSQSDLKAIAALQVNSWQTAYRGLVSDAFLDEEVPQALAEHWSALPGTDWLVIAVREGDSLVGFVAIKRGFGEELAYVDNLHVEPRLKGRGIGTMLMREAARQLSAQGEAGVWLTVLHDNAPSRQFYRSIKGQEGPLKHETMMGHPVQSVPVYWRDLSVLSSLR